MFDSSGKINKCSISNIISSKDISFGITLSGGPVTVRKTSVDNIRGVAAAGTFLAELSSTIIRKIQINDIVGTGSDEIFGIQSVGVFADNVKDLSLCKVHVNNVSAPSSSTNISGFYLPLTNVNFDNCTAKNITTTPQ